jgi:hypothetical protein
MACCGEQEERSGIARRETGEKQVEGDMREMCRATKVGLKET